ncbi:stress protein, member of the CspA-family [Legionella quinlivanii]|uniref:Stress protein, member of the CspA-family n=1 Tax=Legionella quinlivanii TaxID=45073 RepID=A0A0W0Y436_9GAMM|nr:cold-shock protein [Legionella quinlivanii]KTD51380.1 stress protein, member of the CspA-family [Legionella quinlivanii]SEG12368.1 cold shock protein (beta-ribbon, CspA family) [Legionella quinlivanii DSM 21216]STY10140.1 stress protein, member of the CspA-family [Legionella quinlivanii]
MTDKIKGKVKWFNAKKGYGFIMANNEDYFVHFREIQCTGFRTLIEGSEVTFVAEHTARGPQALNVEITGSETRN